MKISIVTPSFNQAPYLSKCIQSVLAQRAEDLEYIVIDGGSTDGSPDIIRGVAGRLAYWHSQADRGHMDALNQGFSHSSGQIMGWINSDDMLTPWALQVVESIFRRFPEVEWVSSVYPLVMDTQDMVISARKTEGYHSEAFFRGRNTPLQPRFYSAFIQQESTFWRRSLWEKAGGRVDPECRVAGDFELWARFFEHAELFGVGVPLGCFRYQPHSFTAQEYGGYLEVCRTVLKRHGRKPPTGLEQWVRRFARRLPRSMYPLTGLAYPVRMIRQTGRGSDWLIQREWIL